MSWLMGCVWCCLWKTFKSWYKMRWTRQWRVYPDIQVTPLFQELHWLVVGFPMQFFKTLHASLFKRSNSLQVTSIQICHLRRRQKEAFSITFPMFWDSPPNRNLVYSSHCGEKLQSYKKKATHILIYLCNFNYIA